MKQMENKQLKTQFDRCQDSYDKFVLTTRSIMLTEDRTIERMRNCKMKILELRQELNDFIKSMEHIAGYIDFPIR